jgi:hypothetical protein
MANTTFNGPVRSQNGFQDITVNSTTGAVTVNGTLGATTSITTLSVSGNSTLSGTANVIIIPTTDPGVSGAIWNDAGTLKVSV